MIVTIVVYSMILYCTPVLFACFVFQTMIIEQSIWVIFGNRNTKRYSYWCVTRDPRKADRLKHCHIKDLFVMWYHVKCCKTVLHAASPSPPLREDNHGLHPDDIAAYKKRKAEKRLAESQNQKQGGRDWHVTGCDVLYVAGGDSSSPGIWWPM